MYEIQKDSSPAAKFHAGEFPVITSVGIVAPEKTIAQYAAVKLTANGIEPVVAIAATEAVSSTVVPAKTANENTIANIYGIAAEAATAGDQVVIYITGQFFAEAIPFPEDVEVETLTSAFRNIGIFLK